MARSPLNTTEQSQGFPHTRGDGPYLECQILYSQTISPHTWGWPTVFNERYAQQKVIGVTPDGKDSPQGQALTEMVSTFNSDNGMVFFNLPPGTPSPISLLGPSGTVSVDIFERFLDRQDRKMTVMFRGSDLRNMSRENDVTGVSAQTEETEALEMAHCANIASACRTFIDRAVIRYCFGEGVEPLAYFGLPDMSAEDSQQLRENAGFLADRGVLVEADTVAERLGVTLTDDPEKALTGNKQNNFAEEPLPNNEGFDDSLATENAEQVDRLEQLIEKTLYSHNGGPGSGRYPKGSGHKWDAPEIKNLKGFFFRIKSDPNGNFQALIGKIHPRVAGRISKALGMNVNELWLHANEYRHVQRHHSEEISEADWEALPKTIENAKTIRPGREEGEPAVEIWVKNDLWKLVVGTGRKGTKRLYVKTFKNRKERE